MAFYSITSLDSKVLGIELAARTRRSFNSIDREPIVRQQAAKVFLSLHFLFQDLTQYQE
jgi:hypothetical protein